MKLLRLFNTIKYLKFEQVYYRIYYKLIKVKVQSCTASGAREWAWSGPTQNHQSIFSKTDVKFLNEQGCVKSVSDWNSPSFSKLWLYNLHYFDDLNSYSYSKREVIHSSFIDRWIQENPPCLGNGWEPYPLSLRIVNWVKWFSRKEFIKTEWLDSLLQQCDALSQQLEYHILGNHLFANAKALTFAGCYLSGHQAEKYLHIGIEILEKEISEQFLDDGAHFELSPMYHEILLWDLLELIDLAETSQRVEMLSRLPAWKSKASKALTWLNTMSHPDGEISFFNDAAIGIAPEPKKLYDYASKLGLDWLSHLPLLSTNKNSGYSRVQFESYSLVYDHANVGPDYLPGHAHADTLSFELSMGKQRVFVNSGTSLYGASAERIRQRQTAAHNTVTVLGCDSSQVWSGFRVAKRAYAKLEKSIGSTGNVQLVASHNGYLQQSPKVKHTRELLCSPDSVIVSDMLSKQLPACFHLHLHPDVDVIKLSEKELKMTKDDEVLCLISSAEPINIKDSTWHPEFGKSIANKKIEIEFANGNLRTEIKQIKRDS